MTKIICKCGHIIADQTDDLPCKGYYIKDTHIEELYEVFDPIDQLIDATCESYSSSRERKTDSKHINDNPED
ncbi:hypothetical protein [Pedobacter steynii]|uniref:Uncharacterized protein n=1 Tax=Pedobacter steynii TaxID=430522 RepID=A0A1D7QI03_9SPHI|nr:hypothetical protein [Pedobacter steynii]AOM78273.1 hypothetical protein BFS30_14490 [Pedobacter steynii]